MKKKIVSKKPYRKELDSALIGEYEKKITFICPVRGKVTQKVIVKQYKSVAVEPRFMIGIDDIYGELDTPISSEPVVEEENVPAEIQEEEPEEDLEPIEDPSQE